MRRLIFLTVLGLSVLIGIPRALGFSLLGLRANVPWQTDRLGYNLNPALGGLGGPVSVGEEYRWNVPVVYYAFTPDFLNYFGQRGVEEVEKAIRFINDLPRASQLNLDLFPLTSQRVNHRAQAVGLVDLKSEALGSLAEVIGICDPTRYVYTLRQRWIGPGGAPTNFHVIKRNFDPVTWQHSSYINGQLWTYSTILDGAANSFAVTEPVDPLALLGLINAPVASTDGNGLLLGGGFWTGFTRDDVGGLRYIYRSDNYHTENSPPNATGTFGGGPWGVPPGGTNAATNLNVFVDLALRPGVDKLEFRRANYDSLLGIFKPITNSFTDTIITNGRAIKQSMERPLAIADILFDGRDIQGPDDPGAGVDFFALILYTIQTWDNNDDVNGVVGNFGPGVIPPATGLPPAAGTPSFIITFDTTGRMFHNIWPFFLSEQNSFLHVIWGSFDGSTNEPVVYPINTSIQDLERQVLGGGGQGNPWGLP